MVFVTRELPDNFDVLAPDGSEVRLLAQASRGSMAHFSLRTGQVSQAVCHKTVEEVWFVLSGVGEMWRARDGEQHMTALRAGTSLTIPVGTSFQFRCTSDSPLDAVAVTMPPWPGPDEALMVPGCWKPSNGAVG